MRLIRVFICFALIILLLGIHPKEIFQKKKNAMCTRGIITALVIILKRWQLNKMSSIRKMVDDLGRDFLGPGQVYGKLMFRQWMHGGIQKGRKDVTALGSESMSKMSSN